MNFKTINVEFQYRDSSNEIKTNQREMNVNENVANYLLDVKSPKHLLYHELVLGSIRTQVLLLYEGIPNSTVILQINSK